MSAMKTLISRASLMLVAAGLLTVAAAQQDQDKDKENSMGASSSRTSTTRNSSGLSAADQKFVKEAAEGGIAEVELGQLAVEKASSDDVKKFAQRMVDDHGKANDQLKQIALSKGIDLPQEPSAKHKATKGRLAKLSGDQFDKAYMTDMLKDHKNDVAAFQRESSSGRDPEVKSFASQTLATLQDHLKEAQNITPKTQRSAIEQPNASQR